MKDALATYMIDWARFLNKEKNLPVRYLSPHNKGEDCSRWLWDGKGKGCFDYNLNWRPDL